MADFPNPGGGKRPSKRNYTKADLEIFSKNAKRGTEIWESESQEQRKEQRDSGLQRWGFDGSSPNTTPRDYNHREGRKEYPDTQEIKQAIALAEHLKGNKDRPLNEQTFVSMLSFKRPVLPPEEAKRLFSEAKKKGLLKEWEGEYVPTFRTKDINVPMNFTIQEGKYSDHLEEKKKKPEKKVHVDSREVIDSWLATHNFKESKKKKDLFYRDQHVFMLFVDYRDGKRLVYAEKKYGQGLPESKRFQVAEKFARDHPELGLTAINKDEVRRKQEAQQRKGSE